MLTNEIVTFIDSLIEHNHVSVNAFSRKQSISKKKAHYEISQANLELSSLQLPAIQLVQGKILIPEGLKKGWSKEQKQLNHRDVLMQEERIYLIILYTFIKKEPISHSHYQDLMQLSKSSVILDLKKVRQLCQRKNVAFSYSRSEGYDFQGTELDIRKLAEYSLGKLLQLSIGEWIIRLIFSKWQVTLPIDSISERLYKIAKSYQVEFVAERMKEFLFLLCFLMERENAREPIFSESEQRFIQSQPLYELGEKVTAEFFQNTSQNEAIFVTVHLLSALQGTPRFYKDETLLKVTDAIINRVQLMTGTNFSDKKALQLSLYEHLVPAYFRILFDSHLENPYAKQIMAEYEELYYLVAKGLAPFEALLNKPIPPNELAYFTIHFGGQLKRKEPMFRTLKALSICPNGISSSLIMNHQLEELFPMIQFNRIHDLKQAKKIDEQEYDMVFSTTYFHTAKKLYLSAPLLNYVEQEMLKRKVFDDFAIEPLNKAVEVSNLIKIIARNATIHHEEELYEALSRSIYGAGLNQLSGGKVLTELLEERFIQFTNEKLEWQEAIALAANPLMKAGYITEHYIASMIDNVHEMGAYIVLAPKTAVPHSRPEDGVKKLGISLLHLENPVDFNLGEEQDEDRQVQLIFVLAAIDSVGHLTALKQLSEILEDEEKIEALIATKDAAAMHQKISQIIEK
ncbi:BglG family transcription antiterminator [Carnobacterium divergens]|uniref:BglG family transcription antiterminator n=1 Tax=Carnobacterium divergens TaxID=2748 RepID=UPI001072CC26|nr:BglG family transcription antiterminator [Carnobacterium divergens]TFI73295.1 transcriptional regulator [Carnobacterium divergens]